MTVARRETGREYEQFGVVARLLVAPETRRAGIATTLLDTAVTAGREQGRLPILDVASHLTAALGLYEHSGWTRLGVVVVRISGDEDPLEEFVYRAPETKLWPPSRRSAMVTTNAAPQRTGGSRQHRTLRIRR